MNWKWNEQGNLVPADSTEEVIEETIEEEVIEEKPKPAPKTKKGK